MGMDHGTHQRTGARSSCSLALPRFYCSFPPGFLSRYLCLPLKSFSQIFPHSSQAPPAEHILLSLLLLLSIFLILSFCPPLCLSLFDFLCKASRAVVVRENESGVSGIYSRANRRSLWPGPTPQVTLLSLCVRQASGSGMPGSFSHSPLWGQCHTSLTH